MMMANLVDFYTRQTLDWNLASAIAIVLLAISGLFIAALMRVHARAGLRARAVQTWADCRRMLRQRAARMPPGT